MTSQSYMRAVDFEKAGNARSATDQFRACAATCRDRLPGATVQGARMAGSASSDRTKAVRRLYPAVPVRALVMMSGLVWSAVGVTLVAVAIGWLADAEGLPATLPWAVGVPAGLVVHHLGFLRISDRNLARLLAMTGWRCLFGFQPWRSWATVAIMVALGATLRHSGLPRPWLATVCFAVGTALALSSVRYWRHAIRGPAAADRQRLT